MLWRLPALVALRRHLRAAGGDSGAAALVRASPGFGELLRCWETVHSSNAVGEHAPLLLALLADLLAAQPASPAEASSATHLALDGLARTVRLAAAAGGGLR